MAEGPRLESSDSPGSVSVIIPLYNGARFIAETLDSVLSQTVPPSEVIVINDGSTDESPEIVRSYGDRVTLITVPNGGECKARNIGCNHASSEWVAFCDSDDLWLPTKLEKQLRLAGEAPDVECVITDYIEYADGHTMGRNHLSYAPEDFWAIEPLPTGFVVRQPITGKLTTFQPSISSTPMVRREFYFRIGGFDEEETRWAPDTTFHFRCLSRVPFGVVPEILMHYRRHPASISADSLKQLRNSVTVWEHIIDRYPEAKPYRAELLEGLNAIRKEVAETERYRRRQKIKRYLGLS